MTRRSRWNAGLGLALGRLASRGSRDAAHLPWSRARCLSHVVGCGLLLVAASVTPSLTPSASAQDCEPGDEFCLPPPPCYREPDNPDCNPDCTCASADYPSCDPYCQAGELCDPDCANPCWDEFGRADVCSDPPPACQMEPGSLPFTFIDDRDGDDNGQIFALGDRDPTRGCGTVRVDTTAYYSIFDTELSESCDDQLDETGYLTVSNRCNPDGYAVERNAGERFLVFDSDNTGRGCADDSACGDGLTCREAGSHGRCCVPTEPVFMGTYLLVEGEDNVICINHWCPDWQAELSAGNDFGFVVSDCGAPSPVNSIHFRIDANAIACVDDTTLHACSWGCGDSGCNPDPCDAVSCEGDTPFCMDGECSDENPCRDLNCEHGCVRGRCLQNRNARGPDEDGDGYSSLADCDDADPADHPGHPEECGDGDDDDCDGLIDEQDCRGAAGDTDAGPPSASDAGPGGAMDAGGDGRPGPGAGGCGCRAFAPTRAPAPALLLGLAFLIARRRR